MGSTIDNLYYQSLKNAFDAKEEPFKHSDYKSIRVALLGIWRYLLTNSREPYQIDLKKTIATRYDDVKNSKSWKMKRQKKLLKTFNFDRVWQLRATSESPNSLDINDPDNLCVGISKQIKVLNTQLQSKTKIGGLKTQAIALNVQSDALQRKYDQYLSQLMQKQVHSRLYMHSDPSLDELKEHEDLAENLLQLSKDCESLQKQLILLYSFSEDKPDIVKYFKPIGNSIPRKLHVLSLATNMNKALHHYKLKQYTESLIYLKKTENNIEQMDHLYGDYYDLTLDLKPLCGATFTLRGKIARCNLKETKENFTKVLRFYNIVLAYFSTPNKHRAAVLRVKSQLCCKFSFSKQPIFS